MISRKCSDPDKRRVFGMKRRMCVHCHAKKFTKFLSLVESPYFERGLSWECLNKLKCARRSPSYGK